MDKIDFKKTLDSYKAKHNQIRIVTVTKMKYLMVDGHGDPNISKEFSDAMETLFPVAYTLKFMSKIDLGKDYVVPPPEGLWWSADMNDFMTGNKSNWDWTIMAYSCQKNIMRYILAISEKCRLTSLKLLFVSPSLSFSGIMLTGT